MQRILFLRTLRHLKKHAFRYAMLCLMAALSMFLVVAIVSAADSVIHTVEAVARETALEDGHFATFVPLSADEIRKIEALGASVEYAPQIDVPAEDGSTLRVMKKRAGINRLNLLKGKAPEAPDEVALERHYAGYRRLKPGDTVRIAGQAFTVSAVVTTSDYDACLRSLSDMSSDPRVFGTAFLSEAGYERVLRGAACAEEHQYSYRLNGKTTQKALKALLRAFVIAPESVRDSAFQAYYQRRTADVRAALGALDRFADQAGRLSPTGPLLRLGLLQFKQEAQRRLTAPLCLPNLVFFAPAEDNMRIRASSGDVEINRSTGLFAGVLVLILITHVISVFVVHGIDRDAPVIGALYALGLKPGQLMLHHSLLPVTVCLIGGAVGTLVGFSPVGLAMMADETMAYYSIPEIRAVHPPLLLAYGLLMPPLVACLVSRLTLRRKLNRPALALLNRQSDEKLPGSARLLGRSFVRSFQWRQMVKERRGTIALLLGMMMSLLILMLGLNCYALCRNLASDAVRDTRYHSMYLLKYPSDQPPRGAHPALTRQLNAQSLGYDLAVSIIGIEEGNPFFPEIHAETQSELAVSRSVADKYGLKQGDVFTLRDKTQDRLYAFTVREIVPCASGLTCLMRLKAMQALFGEPEFNTLFSDRALALDAGTVFSVSTRRDIEVSCSKFMELLMDMILTMVACAVLLFVIVTYQMTRVMVDRSAEGISLFKVFGYRDQEVRRFYLDGSLVLVAAGAALMIPPAKLIMDAIYPYFIANVPCGLNLVWPWYLYPAVYLGMMLCYLPVRASLVRRLRRVSPAAAIRERE